MVYCKSCLKSISLPDQEHDNESGPSHYTSLDGHASEGEDETMPDFKVFLHRKASLNPILESISYSTID